MYNEDEVVIAQRNGDIFPVIANLVIAVFTAAFLWAAASYYQKQIGSVSLQESRFVTTEWHLMQEFKAQTERQLKSKEEEIARLRREFQRLKRSGSDTQSLQKIEEKLRLAQVERDSLIFRQLDTGTITGDTVTQESEASSPSQSATALTELLRQRIEDLRSNLAEHQMQNKEMTSELSALREEKRRLEDEYQNMRAEYVRRNNRLSARILHLEEAINTVRRDFQEKKVSVEQKHPLLEELNTRALLMAILRSPEIHSSYPELPNAVTEYFSVYGRHEYSEGRIEAYAAAILALERLERELQEP